MYSVASTSRSPSAGGPIGAVIWVCLMLYWISPETDLWKVAAHFGLIYLLISGVWCLNSQYLFERGIKRSIELNRRICVGYYRGDGNW